MSLYRRVWWSTVALAEVSSVQTRSRRGRLRVWRIRRSHSLSCSSVPLMSVANVWILGGYQTDFARNLSREGHDFADLTAEVVNSTLAAAKLDAADVDVV